MFKRGIFVHVTDVAIMAGTDHSLRTPYKPDIIVNCTGLGARTLGGVNDTSLYPVRGQIVLVRNDSGGIHSLSGTDDGDTDRTYLMARAAGGGTVLGGCYDAVNTDSAVDPNLAVRIMKRSVELCPALTGGKGSSEHLDIVRHAVGLRPVREGGPRVERETIDNIQVVHNYGHGGAGYQCSYGCARDAVKLVQEALTP